MDSLLKLLFLWLVHAKLRAGLKTLDRRIVDDQELLRDLSLCHLFEGDLVLQSLHLVVDTHLHLVEKVILALLLSGKQEHDIQRSFVEILRLIEVYLEESKRD